MRAPTISAIICAISLAACGHAVVTSAGSRDADVVAGVSNSGAVHVRGTFTKEDLEGIEAAVRREDDQPLLSIVQRPGGGVEVMTGTVCGDLCGGGKIFVLRKVTGTWTVVDRGVWVS
jgi:hypothetical protein